MFSGFDAIDFVITKYPPELRESIRQDIKQILERDRGWINSQLQMKLSNYHCCNVFQAFDADLQELLSYRSAFDSILLS